MIDKQNNSLNKDSSVDDNSPSTNPNTTQTNITQTNSTWFEDTSGLDASRRTQVSTNNSKNQTLELLIEKPQVTLERVITGSLKVSKQVKTQTINVPITLTQEVLVIEHTVQPNQSTQDDLVKIIEPSSTHLPEVIINGQAVALGNQPLEIIISQQIAKVTVETQITEEVKIHTTTQTHEQQIPVTLRHEELVTEEIKLDNPTLISSKLMEDVNITKK